MPAGTFRDLGAVYLHDLAFAQRDTLTEWGAFTGVRAVTHAIKDGLQQPVSRSA